MQNGSERVTRDQNGSCDTRRRDVSVFSGANHIVFIFFNGCFGYVLFASSPVGFSLFLRFFRDTPHYFGDFSPSSEAIFKILDAAFRKIDALFKSGQFITQTFT